MIELCKKVLKAFVRVIIAIVVLFVLANVAFIYLGGYWENMAVFNRISGPKRFKQFVAKPVPRNIHNLRGGYSGFPQGIVRTYFDYSGEFSNMGFLAKWAKVQDPNRSGAYFSYMEDLNATTVYRKKHYSSYMYLLINEGGKNGMLLLP